MSAIKQQLIDDMKAAMKAGEKPKLGAIRLINAAIKQWEVDNRENVDDTRVLVLLDKLAKQRRDSIEQFEKANRNDLVVIEQFELGIIAQYLPEPLNDADIESLIQKAIADTGASSMRDMGAVMAKIKPTLQGRADMGSVSQKIKTLLG